VLRGLSREPAQRFSSMGELLAAIEANVPRDPDLDPTLVVHERQMLSALFLFFAGASSLMLTGVGARLLTRPAGLIALPATILALMVAVIAWRWSSFACNQYGLRLAWMFPGGVFAVLGHRLIALRLGLPVAHVLVEDMVVIATLYAVVAQTQDRWVGWLALIT